MTGRLLSGISDLIILAGIWLAALWFINFDCHRANPWDDPFLWVFSPLLIVGGILHYVGLSIHWTKESGLWKEIFETTSYWQRMTGNIPVVKYDKLPPPYLKKKTSIIIGITLMTSGILTIIAVILLQIPITYFLTTSILAFICGWFVPNYFF
jgi:hypothetical protein